MRTYKDYSGDIEALVTEYDYLKELTTHLDQLGAEPFDSSTVHKIVLWKLNRYPELEAAALDGLNRVRDIGPGRHRDATGILELLLKQKGIDLAMASTMLRFRNPEVFQIIDRHAYRAVYGESLEAHDSETYMTYLDRLWKMREDGSLWKGIPFRMMDRALYLLDKKLNPDLTLDGTARQSRERAFEHAGTTGSRDNAPQTDDEPPPIADAPTAEEAWARAETAGDLLPWESGE